MHGILGTTPRDQGSSNYCLHQVRIRIEYVPVLLSTAIITSLAKGFWCKGKSLTTPKENEIEGWLHFLQYWEPSHPSGFPGGWGENEDPKHKDLDEHKVDPFALAEHSPYGRQLEWGPVTSSTFTTTQQSIWP